MYTGSVLADSHHFDEEQDLDIDQHYSEKLDPDLDLDPY
jgi:hypothetical protein